ncbi:MAG: response regulator [Fibrobacterota bacterium]|nr:response regulator [Fibrobacterota bacterium]
MGPISLYDILQDITRGLSETHSFIRPLPTVLESKARIVDLGLNADSLPLILQELRIRLAGREINILASLGKETVYSLSLKPFLKALQESVDAAAHTPIVVYVDDEEENIFIFKRYFGKHIRLETFTDPEKAFEYIRGESAVRLVITDEVMPALTGTALCNAIRRTKPHLKFIMLTGNPSGEKDLMINSLKAGKFHDFINKPIDLERRGGEYVAMILALLHAETLG